MSYLTHYPTFKVELFVVDGLQNLTKLIEFNDSDASMWQSLALTSAKHVIRLPANSSIVVENFSYEPDLLGTYLGVVISSPCTSVIETPSYGSLQIYEGSELGDPLIYIIQNNITVKFTVSSYDISKDGTLGFQDSKGISHFLNSTQNSIEFISDTVTLFYTEPLTGYKGAIIFLNAFFKN